MKVDTLQEIFERVVEGIKERIKEVIYTMEYVLKLYRKKPETKQNELLDNNISKY